MDGAGPAAAVGCCLLCSAGTDGDTAPLQSLESIRITAISWEHCTGVYGLAKATSKTALFDGWTKVDSPTWTCPP